MALIAEQLWQSQPGGSGTYILNLGRSLTEQGVDVRGVAALHLRPPSETWRPPFPVTSLPMPRPMLYEAWARLPFAGVAYAGRGADVVHATTWAVPRTRAPLVVTVHDLAFLHAPEHFTAHGNDYFRRALAAVRSRADAVIVPSEATRSDCVLHGIEDDRLVVIPHGVRVPAVEPGERDGWRRRYGVERPFVLWCGTFEPRKNIGGLLDAYAALLGRSTPLDLVLVGPTGWGGVEQSVRERLASMPSGRVHLLGELDVADLHRAYASARVFCFPSLAEGFGLPVLEAMAHGTPVVTSSGTPMASLVGAAGAIVDPRAPECIATAIERVVGDEHDSRSAAARDVARAFTWDEAARRTVEVYYAIQRVGRSGLHRT